ncbi:membrane-bound transcription factor site-2 protease [Diorhabda sublineata]|uniref:membrane-bound transcription factor site-2 protease n=1 Tax=Diorhabda sublineata TaxID=1163346 RepID=UPI0024E05DF6|nr:membrane-bound transcription factor site-2 protease [Diorhabda sublineata]
MDITTAIIVIFVIYGILMFFDNFFKTCAHYPYIKFLEGTGFQIKFLTIKWQTKAFNRTIIRWGSNKPHFWNAWFNTGLYVNLVLLPISITLLLYSILQHFLISNEQNSNFVLEPVIPGFNLPASEIGYYSATLIVASIVHELGHALAAVMEDVNLIDVGVSIFFLLPVAYVNLATEKLFSIERKKTLRILCAGIWHNVVLSTIALILYLLLPLIFSGNFYVNNGVTVTNVAKNSPLIGSKGLVPGDVILKINNCRISNEESYYECFNDMNTHQVAFCIDAELIHNLDESIPLKHSTNGNLDCCDGTKFENICFEYLENNDRILELPAHVCLPARKVIEKSTFCTQTLHVCPKNKYCFKPMPGNSTYLMKLTCKNKIVIYLGHPGDVYKTVQISPYIPKFIFTTTIVPDCITKFTKYIVVISFGLAVVNIIPFMYMDGQYILEVLGYILLRKKMGKTQYKVTVSVITVFFTLILFIHCITFLYKQIFI